MPISDFCYMGLYNFNLNNYSTEAPKNENKNDCLKRLEKNLKEISEYQEKQYAQETEGLIIIVQALDAAGKDSVIKHVFACFNQQACNVAAFKAPSPEELRHDYMWRAFKQLPARGNIAVFNRSYYEDVLVVKVHKLYKKYNLPKRCLDIDPEEFFRQRYEQIVNFEKFIYQNGYRVVKLFLNVSAQKQAERFVDRLQKSDKYWKFDSKDLVERELRSEYISAYVKAISSTATEYAPWYIIPADTKWFTHCLISDVLLDAYKNMNPQYPELPENEKIQIPIYLDKLVKELK